MLQMNITTHVRQKQAYFCFYEQFNFSLFKKHCEAEKQKKNFARKKKQILSAPAYLSKNLPNDNQ
jgi:hypothetical protein